MSKSIEAFEQSRALAGWTVLMVRHPQTGLYYSAGFKLGQ